MGRANNAKTARNQTSFGQHAPRVHLDMLAEKGLASNVVPGKCQVMTFLCACRARQEHMGQMAKPAKPASRDSNPTWEELDAMIVALDCTLQMAQNA